MNTKKTYAEKLRDPRWQKKRLEILERDKFMCQNCGDEDNTLHVHHIRYIANKEPWEYDNSYLITLCVDCHETVSNLKHDIKAMIDQNFIHCEHLEELSLIIFHISNLDPLDLRNLWKSIQSKNG